MFLYHVYRFNCQSITNYKLKAKNILGWCHECCQSNNVFTRFLLKILEHIYFFMLHLKRFRMALFSFFFRLNRNVGKINIKCSFREMGVFEELRVNAKQMVRLESYTL